VASPRKTILTGLATFVGGFALWQWGLDVEIVVFVPSKIGVVLMVVGGLETAYGLFKAFRAQEGGNFRS
jgi:phage-related protein